jgi:hypothetical protein
MKHEVLLLENLKGRGKFGDFGVQRTVILNGHAGIMKVYWNNVAQVKYPWQTA